MDLKRINSDKSPASLNTTLEYSHAKNVINFFEKVFNERGNDFSEDLLEKFNGASAGLIIGAIPAGDHIILFSVNDSGFSADFGDDFGESEIGVFNCVTQEYTTVANLFDPAIDLDFQFNPDYPIFGTYRINFKGDCEIAWTDNLNSPRIINIGPLDNPIVTDVDSLNDTLVFPEGQISNINFEVEDGNGSIETGLYFITYRYKNSDNSTSNYMNFSKPIWINDESISSGYDDNDGAEAGTPTSKSIRITFDNVDTRYEFIELIVIKIINGAFTPLYVRDVNIFNEETISTVYTGSETFEVISLEEILVKTPSYRTAKTITQINKRLYLANLTSEDSIDYQSVANDIKINWRLEGDIDEFNNDSTYVIGGGVTGDEPQPSIYDYDKGFQHNEVYAFYIRFWLKNGSVTRAFHIPGRLPVAGDLDPSSLANTGFDIQPLKYQIEDTTDSGGTTNMGYWENQNEQYPSFGGYPTGNIRHHRFPTIRKIKSELYAGSTSNYARNAFHKLTIDVSNVINVPTSVQGWEILYAKRSYSNSTVLDMDLFQFAGQSRPKRDGLLGEQEEDIESVYNATTSGGNWVMPGFLGGFPYPPPFNNRDQFPAPNIESSNAIVPRNDYIRWNGFNMLYDKPVASNTYIRNELVMQNLFSEWDEVTSPPFPNRWFRTQHLYISPAEEYDGHIFGHIKIANTGVSPIFGTPSDEVVRSLSEAKYLVANGTGNRDGEECLRFKISNGDSLNFVNNIPMNVGDNTLGYRQFVRGNDYTEERTYLSVLCRNLNDIYISFLDQELVSTNQIFPRTESTSQGKFLDGDVFISEYTSVTTFPLSGNKFRPALADVLVYDSIQDKYVPWLSINSSFHPIRAIARSFLSESIHNIGLRHLDETNKQTWFYPKKTLDPAGAEFVSGGNVGTIVSFRDVFLPQMDQHLPIEILYNKDYSGLNTLTTSSIFTPLVDFVDKFPHRIVRSRKYGVEDQNVSWKSWRPNDVYEQVKNRGVIVNVEAFGDNLIIHHEYGLFVTRDKANFESTDIVTVSLGSGDIFELEPKEVLPATGSSAHVGLQSQHSYVLGRIGYIFANEIEGKVFIFTGELDEISNTGSRNFFKDHLAHKAITIEEVQIELEYELCNSRISVPKQVDCYDILPNLEITDLDDVVVPINNFIIGDDQYIITISNPGAIPVKGKLKFHALKRTTEKYYPDNPWKNRGISIAYDEEHNRILLSKNDKATTRLIEGVEVDKFNIVGSIEGFLDIDCDNIDKYQDGDIVIVDGEYYEFSTTGDCDIKQIVTCCPKCEPSLEGLWINPVCEVTTINGVDIPTGNAFYQNLQIWFDLDGNGTPDVYSGQTFYLSQVYLGITDVELAALTGLTVPQAAALLAIRNVPDPAACGIVVAATFCEDDWEYRDPIANTGEDSDPAAGTGKFFPSLQENENKTTIFFENLTLATSPVTGPGVWPVNSGDDVRLTFKVEDHSFRRIERVILNGIEVTPTSIEYTQGVPYTWIYDLTNVTVSQIFEVCVRYSFHSRYDNAFFNILPEAFLPPTGVDIWNDMLFDLSIQNPYRNDYFQQLDSAKRPVRILAPTPYLNFDGIDDELYIDDYLFKHRISHTTLCSEVDTNPNGCPSAYLSCGGISCSSEYGFAELYTSIAGINTGNCYQDGSRYYTVLDCSAGRSSIHQMRIRKSPIKGTYSTNVAPTLTPPFNREIGFAFSGAGNCQDFSFIGNTESIIEAGSRKCIGTIEPIPTNPPTNSVGVTASPFPYNTNNSVIQWWERQCPIGGIGLGSNQKPAGSDSRFFESHRIGIKHPNTIETYGAENRASVANAKMKVFGLFYVAERHSFGEMFYVRDDMFTRHNVTTSYTVPPNP